MELTPIDYIAQMINDQVSTAEGYTAPTRWGTLRQDLKDKYKTEAEKLFKDWKADEFEAEQSRNNIMKDVKIIQV